MARRNRTTPKTSAAARHNVRRAQMSRVGRREVRSIGRHDAKLRRRLGRRA